VSVSDKAASPRIAVLHAPGTNRDGEAARAVELAGATPVIVPVGNRALTGHGAGPGRTSPAPDPPQAPHAALARLEAFQGVIVPGGFSYGDALGAGARLALELADELAAFAALGRPVLGICNGFQALVKAGLLTECAGRPQRRVTLTHNADGRFVCRWVHLAPVANARADLAPSLPTLIACPVAHGEGRIAVSSPSVVDDLERAGQVLFRYVGADGSPAQGSHPANPNGSAGDIAGLCNPEGNVWGLMPHPEDHLECAQDPFRRPGRSGLPLFQAFVERARAH
jgi:phosphoribosylformylglycinamidine synthase